jgi:ubiquinone/menaquinone biosynthesis C-methylase UbiE
MHHRQLPKSYEGLPKITTGWEKYYSSLHQLPGRLKTPVPLVTDELPTLRHYHVKNVLDLGCGAGRNCLFLAKEGLDVVSLDISGSALRITNAWRHKKRLMNMALAHGTMTNLPFGNGCFDAVISISVIHHAVKKDIERIINEVYRILRKNGIFFTNAASIEDPRYGEGEEVEENTFRILEAFEENRFEELHHFVTRPEISEMFACFDRLEVELLKEKPHYWKIMAIK